MKRYIKQILFISVLMTVFWLTAGGRPVQAQTMQEEIAGKVLRFHVRANSDTKLDQYLKLQVRDAVALYMQQQLKEAQSREEAIDITGEHLEKIEEIAEETLRKQGNENSVSAVIETDYFPEKTYGIYTFPEGSYEALIVSIGEAKGHNWWCVMYPNLCFIDGVYEEPEEESEQLKNVLTEEEYDSLLNGGTCKIRFKYLTFLNELFE